MSVFANFKPSILLPLPILFINLKINNFDYKYISNIYI